MSFCLSCGAKLSPSARFCTTCGKVKAAPTSGGGGVQWTPEEAKIRAREEAQQKRQEQLKHQQELESQRAGKFSQYRDAPQCTKCGARLSETTRFCTGCGTPRKTLEELGLAGQPKATPGVATPAPTTKPDVELEKKRLAAEKAESDKRKEAEERDKREKEEREKKSEKGKKENEKKP